MAASAALFCEGLHGGYTGPGGGVARGVDRWWETPAACRVHRWRQPLINRLQPYPGLCMRQPTVIAPSILSANFARLGDDVARVIEAGADWIHFDVMDNHYVPNLTFGPMICEALKPYVGKAMMDVHLMVEPVDALVQPFAQAGAGLISFHPEASRHVDRTLALIRDSGCQAGLVFNPATPLAWLDHVMDKLDLVMLMSVNPGFGGQRFIPATIPKLAAVRQRLDAYFERSGRAIRLEVDGGVKPDNIAEIARAGADTFVAGSAVFGSADWAATIAALKAGARTAAGPV